MGKTEYERVTQTIANAAKAAEGWLGVGRVVNNKTIAELTAVLKKAILEGSLVGDHAFYNVEVVSAEVVFDVELQKNKLQLNVNLTQDTRRTT